MPAIVKRISLTGWIVIALVVGVFVGWQFPETAKNLSFLTNIFLHLIKCIIVPLIFSTLVVGIAGHTDDMRSVGTLALKSLIYFEIVTTFALFIGLAAANLLQPGNGIHLNTAAAASKASASTKMTFAGVIDHLTPESFFDSAARNDVLQVVVFAIIFGVALARVQEKPRRTMLAFCESLSEVMFKFTGMVMWFAPLGVGAAVASTIGENGF